MEILTKEYIKENVMPIIGIVAKSKDIQIIRKDINNCDIKLIEITENSIRNLKNIKFDEIIFLENINIKDETYKYMEDILSKVNYLIINMDIPIDTFRKIKIKKPIKLITFGFNAKATITISSVKHDKIIIFLQREIQKSDKSILEIQEKELKISAQKSKKIYNNLTVFIIKELHNL